MLQWKTPSSMMLQWKTPSSMMLQWKTPSSMMLQWKTPSSRGLKHSNTLLSSIESCSRVQDFAMIKNLVAEHSPRKQKLNYMGHLYPQALNLIVGILRKGLGERVRHIGIMLPSTERWQLAKFPPSSGQPITLGLTLNPEFAFSVLEKGPGANLPEVGIDLATLLS
jgi:hypothetical protein